MPAGQPGDPSGAEPGQVRRHRRRRRRRLAVALGAVAVAAAAVATLALSLSSGGRSPEHRPPAGWPAAGGFPDARTTGVPDGVPLVERGTLHVTEDGAVVENLLIVDGYIDVQADDVTIRNVRITTDRAFVQWGIVQQEGFGGLVVEDSEIFGNDVQQLASGISNRGGMITVRRVEIHSITDGIVSSQGVIEDSYLHSPTLFEGDHTDMIQTVGGSPADLPLEIRHNTIINTEPQTAAVFLDDSTGNGLIPVRNVLVEGNLLAGGGYTVYGGGLEAEGHDPENIVIRDNVFSRRLWPDSGYYGPVAYFDVDAPGCVWSGNVWDDGSPVELDRS